nr:MAG TPA: hypothetical protein [Caudoviricetes sp.]
MKYLKNSDLSTDCQRKFCCQRIALTVYVDRL